ncbi:hypothetical protein Tco_1234305, partial [Tanacetum coccineum]
MFDESLSPPPNVDLQAPEVIVPILEAVAPEHAMSTGSPSSTTVDQDAPSPSNSPTTQETQSPRGIFINQSKYALESLKKYGFESCDLVDTPMVEKSKLDEDKEGKAARPTEKHLNAVKRIFQYLKGTVNRGLWYPMDSSIALIAFADADHASCQDIHRSTSG